MTIWKQDECAACGAATTAFTQRYRLHEAVPGQLADFDVRDAPVCNGCWGTSAFYPDDPRALTAAIRTRLATAAAAPPGDLLEVWIKSQMLPVEEQAKTPCTQIFIPKVCVTCGKETTVSHMGDGQNETWFFNLCSHRGNWLIIAALRVEPAALAPSGPPCCKRCGEFNSYQSGPFTCWQCQQDPWR